MSDYGFLILSVFIVVVVFAIRRNIGGVKWNSTKRIRYISEDVVLRDKPSEGFQKVAFLEFGQKVIHINEKEGWSKIKVFKEGDKGEAITGYVQREMIRREKPSK